MKQFFLKRSSRLTLSIGLVSFILFGVSVYTFQRINRLALLTKELYDHPFTVNRAVLRVESGIISMQRSMKDITLANDLKEMKIAKEKVAQSEKQVLENFDIIIENFLGDTNLIKEARQNFVQWRSIRERVIILSEAGKIKEAAAITKDKGEEYIKSLLSEMDEFEAFAANKAIQFLDSVEQTRHEIFSLSIVLIILIISLIILLILRYSLSLKEKTEKDIRQLSNRLNLALESANIGIWEWDIKQNHVIWDERMYQLYGINSETFISNYEGWASFLHPEDRVMTETTIQEALQERKDYNIEFRVIHPDSSIHFLQANGMIQKNSQGEPVKIIGINYDISDRKQVEFEKNEQIHQEFKLLESILEIILAGYWDWNLKEDITYFSPRLKKMFGYEDDELPNTPEIWQKLISPEDLPKVMNIFENHIKSKSKVPFSNEIRYRHKNGSTVWIICTGQVVEWDAKGQPLRIIGCNIDLTNQKQTEKDLFKAKKELEIKEQMFRSTFAQAAVGIAHVSPEGRFLRLNEKFCDIAGYPMEELTLLTFQDITHPDDLNADLAYVKQVIKGEIQTYSMEKRYITKEGIYVWINLTVSLVRNPDESPNYFIAVIENINQRKKTEHNLKDMTYALNTASIVAITDEKGKITFVNDLFCEISQYSKEELIGQNHRILSSGYHPHEFFVELWKTISSGQIWRAEIKNRAKDGSCYWVDTTIVPFLNPQGKPYQYLAIRSDITERKTGDIKLQEEIKEKQKAMEKLEQMTKQLEESNKELQDFSYVASHDLQEPLRKIQAFGDRLKSTCEDDLSEKGQDYLARMLNAAHRGQNLINDLLSFSRVTTKARPFEAIDLNEVLKGVLSDLEIRIEETGAIMEIDTLPVIEADAMQMRQTFQNILSNALKFMKKEVKLLIQLQAFVYQEEEKYYCEIRIIDNGIGFDQKYAEQIFQPFQRLHGRKAYEGSGIGLAICRKIAQRHHGKLIAESIPDVGTTFILTLPIYQKKSLEQSTESDS